jgi:hypothetical protein
MDDKIRNVLPDLPDLRDRTYNPTLRLLWRTWNEKPYADMLWKSRVKDQGTTAACTGFALAAMTEVLLWKQWLEYGMKGPLPERISPFMLYYFARRYDDIPEGDPNGGSSARGAMKAWFAQGACHLSFWDSSKEDDKPEGTQWMVDAFKTPLGAYFRVDHRSIPDIHAAINETTVVYATAQLHEGWGNPENGKIAFDQTFQPMGGHAFILIGYDENGFWIQNSWGANWGINGFAHLSYTDWSAHAMDTWVGQLGVYRSTHLESLASGLDLTRLSMGRVASPQTAQSVLLSGNDSISAQQINPYIINVGDNGVLSDVGPFATTVDDLRALLKTYIPNAAAQFGIGADGPIDIAIYAHGGLTDENGAAQTARSWIPAIYSKKIFPVFIMWETGFLETLQDILEDAGAIFNRAAGGPLDVLTDWWDERLETLASVPGTLAWNEMKKNADAISTNSLGALQLLYNELLQSQYQSLRSRLRLHLIGHSAGAILHASLLPALIGAGLKVDGIYFMAPACRNELFNEKILPYYRSGKVNAYAEFHLTDSAERQDNCATIYRRSLLYLVSNAFEQQRGMPILGMEKFFTVLPQKTDTPPLPGQLWDWIASPTGANVPVQNRSNSVSHGGFSSDADTQRAILARISARL